MFLGAGKIHTKTKQKKKNIMHKQMNVNNFSDVKLSLKLVIATALTI